jgi:hypothetical protein
MGFATACVHLHPETWPRTGRSGKVLTPGP